MDLVISYAALLVALAALALAIAAIRRAGRGAGMAAVGRAAPPDRSPPPEFVKPAPTATLGPPRVHAPADPLLVARVDALEARVGALSSEEPRAPAPRRPAPRGDAEDEAAPRPESARRAFP